MTRLPNAFIIGVQKAGTTSLHNWLSQHPDIFAPIESKDVDYFANPQKYKVIKKRFKEDYSMYNNESIVLQTHVNYIFYSSALNRIKTVAPNAKLIVSLRNPVERALSAYHYFKKMGRENRTIENALLYEPEEIIDYSQKNNDLTYLEHGMYGQQLEHVYKIFDYKNVFIVQFDELKNKPEQLVEKVYDFLGVNTTFKPIFKKKNQTGSVHLEWLHNKLTDHGLMRQLFIKYLIQWWLPLRKRQYIRKELIQLNTKKEKPVKVSHEVKKKLQKVFEEDQKKLNLLLSEVNKAFYFSK